MFAIFWLFVIVVLFWLAFIFNHLVALRNRAKAAWSDIDVQLKRRHDLIGNLVETVKGYVQHERSTLEEVVRARTVAETARDAGKPGAAGAAENALGGQVRGLFALAEAYPDLKASDRFLDLQRSLSDGRKRSPERPPLLQRGGARLQHPGPVVSRPSGGAAPGLSRARVLRTR